MRSKRPWPSNPARTNLPGYIEGKWPRQTALQSGPDHSGDHLRRHPDNLFGDESGEVGHLFEPSRAGMGLTALYVMFHFLRSNSVHLSLSIEAGKYTICSKIDYSGNVGFAELFLLDR